MSLQQTIKHSSLCATNRNLFFAVVAVSLLISGIVRPLLVECTPADGHTTLELIGRDPHHHIHSERYCEFSKRETGDSFSLCAGVIGQCVDLFLNHTATLRTGSHHSLPVTFLEASGSLFVPMDSRTFPAFDFLADPALQISPNPQFRKPLLI